MDTVTQRAVRACIDANVPVLLWGPPGVGKSSALAAMAAAAGRSMEVVLGSVREASDFAGLPIVQPDGRSVVMAPPDWALRLAVADGGWLFLDDVTTTAPSVQKAMLQVVLDRKVGDFVSDHRNSRSAIIECRGAAISEGRG